MGRGTVLFLMLVFFEIPVACQHLLGVTAGMGIDLHSAPGVSDYVNAITQPGTSERFEEFSSAVEFFIAPEMQISDEWSIGIEYALLLKSHTVSKSVGGPSEFSYTVHLPALIAHYLITGEGYLVKFGGGAGYATGEFSQRLYGSFGWTDFRSTGLTVKLEAIGNTKFDESFYGSIGIDLRWIEGGVFKGNAVEAGVGGSKAEMRFFNVGLKFGVMFLL